MEPLARTGLSMMFFCTACAGAVMLSLSLLFGHDHEADHEVDHEHDTGHESDTEGLSIFSFKVIMMFLTGFGAGGFFGARAGFQALASSLWGLAAGVVMGGLGYTLMNYLYKHQGSSVVKTSSVVGSYGVVDTTITPGGIGQIRCTVDGCAEYFQARTRGGDIIHAAEKVKVIDAAGGVLVVEKASE